MQCSLASHVTAESEFETTDVPASAGIGDHIDADIRDDIAENVDRQAGYHHEATSDIQTLLSELETSSVDTADEAEGQTDQTAGINRKMDHRVEDLQRNN